MTFISQSHMWSVDQWENSIFAALNLSGILSACPCMVVFLSIKIGNPNCFKFRECCLFLEVCSSPTPHWFLYSFNAKLFDGRNKYTQQRYLTRKNNKMNVKVLLSTKEVSSFKRDSNANLLFWDCLKVRLLQCAKIFDSNSFCTLLCGCVSEKERRFDFLHFYI